MSTLETNLIQPSTGTALTVGASGDTITVPSGATFNVAGTLQSGGSAITQGITIADQWRVTSATSFGSSVADITANFEQIDTTGQGTIGTAMSESSGIFTFPQTGIYLVTATISAYRSGDARYVNLLIKGTTNNSAYSTFAQSYGSIEQAESNSTYTNVITSTFVDVTDTSNVKVKFSIRATQDCYFKGASDNNENSFTFIRLGDT